MDIQTIHESLINGQRRQMVEQIDDYTRTDFFSTYDNFLNSLNFTPVQILAYYTDATKSYFRIKDRY